MADAAATEQRRQERLARLASARNNQKRGFPLLLTLTLVFVFLVTLIIFFDWLLLRL